MIARSYFNKDVKYSSQWNIATCAIDLVRQIDCSCRFLNNDPQVSPVALNEQKHHQVDTDLTDDTIRLVNVLDQHGGCSGKFTRIVIWVLLFELYKYEPTFKEIELASQKKP